MYRFKERTLDFFTLLPIKKANAGGYTPVKLKLFFILFYEMEKCGKSISESNYLPISWIKENNIIK